MPTSFPAAEAQRPDRIPGRVFHGGDLRCAILIGSQRRLTTLLAASGDRFLIAGWQGLALGTRLHLIIERGRPFVRECAVIGATTRGIELACLDGEPAPPPVTRLAA